MDRVLKGDGMAMATMFLRKWKGLVRELPGLLCSQQARRAARGMVILRRAYEHVLVLAVIEGARPVRRPYYDAYVDALNVLGAKAALIARTL